MFCFIPFDFTGFPKYFAKRAKPVRDKLTKLMCYATMLLPKYPEI